MTKFGLFSVNSDLFRTSLAQKVRIRTFSANADHSGSTGVVSASSEWSLTKIKMLVRAVLIRILIVFQMLL